MWFIRLTAEGRKANFLLLRKSLLGYFPFIQIIDFSISKLKQNLQFNMPHLTLI